jgi:hypothetical protein
MRIFECQEGQSFTDVCLNTYGSINYFIKLLNDNNLSPLDVPFSGQKILWDDSLVENQSIQSLITKNNVIFATMPAPPLIEDVSYLLQENGDFILQENGEKILL